MLYPNKIKKNNTFSGLKISHSNRGMNLENLINLSNTYYKDSNIALIYKKPTPIGVVDIDYINNKKVIKKAYFQEQSTLDYCGVYKGKYLDFDAKETNSKTAFPLANIHNHQTDHIREVIKHGGFAFLIIKVNNSYYLLSGEDYLMFIETENRKSIPYSYILEKCYKITESYKPALNYLEIVDKVYFKGE